MTTGTIEGLGSGSDREFDLVVFGATGLTGCLVVEQLASVDALLQGSDGSRRWSVAGRDRQRVAKILADLSLESVQIIVADLVDKPSLAALAERATVVLNLAGPYTKTAPDLIAACVDAGSSYVDLSGRFRCCDGLWIVSTRLRGAPTFR
jgi:short subunit dehydrogenase-like uncharacterized protein